MGPRRYVAIGSKVSILYLRCAARILTETGRAAVVFQFSI